MRTLEPIETDKIESWLDRVELFLMELQATDRAQLILDLNQQIQAQLMVSHDLKVEDVLKKMGDPMQVANRVRVERGFKARKRSKQSQPRSIGSFLVLSILGVFLFFGACTISLPFVVPWGLNRLATKMGQQPEGVQSFHFFKNFKGFSPSSPQDDKHDPNDLNAESAAPPDSEEADDSSSQSESVSGAVVGGQSEENIKGNFQSDGMTAVHVQAKNTKLILTTTKKSGIDYDCKIASLGYARPFIRKSPSGTVTLALDQVSENASCEVKIPEGVSIEIQIQSGEIQLQQTSQNISVEATQAEVYFTPNDQISFEIEANTKKGEVKGLNEFEKKQMTLKTEKKFRAKFSLDAGNIYFGPAPK